MVSAQNGYIKIVELLLSSGAKIDIKNSKKYSVIHIAVYNKKPDVLKEILSYYENDDEIFYIAGAVLGLHGPDLGDFDLKMHKILMDGVNNIMLFKSSEKDNSYSGKMDKIIDLLKKGANINYINKKKKLTPLLSSILNNYIDIANYLIINGADVNIKAKGGVSSLALTAALHNDIDLFNNLIKMGADINSMDDTKLSSVLMVACKLGKKDYVKILIDNKADVNLKNIKNETALISALYFLASAKNEADISNGKEIVKYIVSSGSDINIKWKDQENLTPLMVAVLLNQPDLVEFLLNNGADKSLTNDKNITALDIAIKNKFTDIEALLKPGN
ncbi:MAG: ankyrin repeat domain-containing protein [Spirochaetes bacterium]|nr:ankyrin repeat domain-containing protein [Spirochaetota bacterium]